MRALKIIYVMAIAAAIIALVIAGVEAFYPRSWVWEGSEAHARNVFFVVLPLGMALSVGGGFLQRRSGVFGASLILGGMGTMVYAIAPYQLDERLRFTGIAVILLILIFLGLRIFLGLKRS
jgi:hypothetical protein